MTLIAFSTISIVISSMVGVKKYIYISRVIMRFGGIECCIMMSKQSDFRDEHVLHTSADVLLKGKHDETGWRRTIRGDENDFSNEPEII